MLLYTVERARILHRWLPEIWIHLTLFPKTCYPWNDFRLWSISIEYCPSGCLFRLYPPVVNLTR
jgi:hypothetical protein